MNRGVVGFVVACAGLLGACVTTYEDAPLFENQLDRPEFAVAQTIPLGTPATEDQRAMLELYDGVLRRLHEAAAERDLDGMLAVLDSYERDKLPPIIRDRLAGYRSLAHGLAFQKHAFRNASLQVVAGQNGAAPAAPSPPGTATTEAKKPALGEPLRIELALPASGEPVRLGGRDDDDPIGFQIAITVEDSYVDGGSREQKDHAIHWLPATIDLSGSAVLRLPIALDIPAGDAVQRTVHLRIDLMPGYITAARRRAPVQRTTVAALSLTQWPAGHEVIVEKPLATLREALRLGDAAHFRHVYLGAVFTTGADRETALGLLIDRVRLGSQPQAMVAMAALRAITDTNLTIGDREAWLVWWQMRR